MVFKNGLLSHTLVHIYLKKSDVKLYLKCMWYCKNEPGVEVAAAIKFH